MHILANKDGYTLIETTVALSIFLLILMPSSLVLIHFIHTNDNLRQAEALMLAQYHMESILYDPESLMYIEEKTTEKESFIIQSTINRKGNLIFLEIHVSGIDSAGPIVSLKTVRIR